MCNKKMRVAVAGATGNVGQHVVRALLDGGHEVRALTRDHRKGEEILGKHERLRLVEGEGDDAGALCTACIKCDAAFLCLLYTSPSPRDATLSRMPSSA